jgi:GalNAc-alpha-(1->4)-GalNAc-alpha-(1->3)-diNAcBac-PP-undecaprenol alpha-1,4-N-acetyl-D-galactosaminyltransferase
MKSVNLTVGTSEMTRIALVIPSLQSGGMERVMSELAFFLCKNDKIQVHLIMYGKRPEVFYKVPGNLIIHKPGREFNNNFRTGSSIRRFFFLRSEIRKLKPYSILSFGEYWNNFVLIALLGLPYPVHISDRCSPEIRLSGIHEKLRKWFYPQAETVIVQTEKAEKLYAELLGRVRIKRIGNPIRFVPADDNIRKEKIVLTVGRLIEQKNHDKLIELFLKINKPDWKLVIVGGDALKQNGMAKLSKLIRDRQGEGRVLLEGNRSDIDSYYNKSRIFAFTSSSEGFPNVVGEAMSAGLPVISFDCIAGPSEMITDGKDGFLIPLNNYDIFQERLEQLMNNNGLCKAMGASARNSIKRFSIENIGSHFCNVILTH